MTDGKGKLMNNIQTASVEATPNSSIKASSPLYIGDYVKKLKFKEKIMRASINKAGVVMIISVVLMLVISFLVVIPIRYAYSEGLMSVKEIEVLENWLNVFMSVIIALPAFLFYIFSKENKVNNFIKAEKGNFLFKLSMLFFGVAAGRLANIPAVLLERFLEGAGIDAGSQSLPINSDISVLLPYILSVVIMAPMIEEFVYRGVILSSIQKHGDGFAVVISGVLFGLMHGSGGIGAVVAASISGVIMGFVYVRTRSIWINIAVHLIYNASAVTSNLAFQFLDEDLATEISAIMVLAVFVLGFISLILLISVYRKKTFGLAPQIQNIPVSDRMKRDYMINRYDAAEETPATSKQIIKSCVTSFSFWIMVFYVGYNLYLNNR